MYNDGWWHMNLRLIVFSLCAPIIGVLGMCICVPYVIANSIVPMLSTY